MFLFEVKRLIWSALEIEFFEVNFLQPAWGGHPVLSGHLAIPRRWPLNTGSTVVTVKYHHKGRFSKQKIKVPSPEEKH